MHRHRFRIVDLEYLRWGFNPVVETLIKRRCEKCGKLTTERIDGRWTISQIVGSV